MPMTPEEFAAKFPPSIPPFSDETAMSCTDAALKTYRIVKVVRQTNARTYQIVDEAGTLFKACSDKDALNILLYNVMDEAYCLRLERLDAKPGYASNWTLVKSTC